MRNIPAWNIHTSFMPFLINCPIYLCLINPVLRYNVATKHSSYYLEMAVFLKFLFSLFNFHIQTAQRELHQIKQKLSR